MEHLFIAGIVLLFIYFNLFAVLLGAYHNDFWVLVLNAGLSVFGAIMYWLVYHAFHHEAGRGGRRRGSR
jgi:phosphate starvation-inducible membrane PsiE